MLKLNLLPTHIFEMQRIKVTLIVFAVLFVIEGGVVLGIQSGLQQRTQWFDDYKKTCDADKVVFDKYATDAGQLKTKAGKYEPWLTMLSLQPHKEVNEGMAKSFIELGNKLTYTGSWFENFILNSDGTFTADGKIHGSMHFLNYYFRCKDVGFELKPAAQPFNASIEHQLISLAVKGKVSAFPAQPSLPLPGDDQSALYKSADAAATPPADGTQPTGTPPANGPKAPPAGQMPK